MAPCLVSVALICGQGPTGTPASAKADARKNSRTVPRGSSICFIRRTRSPSMAVGVTENGVTAGAGIDGEVIGSS